MAAPDTSHWARDFFNRWRDRFWLHVLTPAASNRRRWQVGLALVLVLTIGIVVYLTRYKVAFLAFYILPISLAVAARGWLFGVLVSILSVATWLAGTLTAGALFDNPFLRDWNATIALASYLVVVMFFNKLLTLHRELEERVRQRTAALTEEIAERRRLEKIILDISERERRNIGRDLHDGLGQHLTGTSLTGQLLVEKLQTQQIAEAADARKLVALIEEGIEQTRRLAKGLVLAEVERDGLPAALEELATATTEQSQVTCEFRSTGDAHFDDSVNIHLYRIAQEAVHNALRHGKARHIEIGLAGADGGWEMSVRDDGAGLPLPAAREHGLGLSIMAHRATMIGASFAIGTPPGGGTLITCRLPPATPAL